MNNKGLNLQKEREAQDGTEYVFGALSLPCITDIPESEREQYLPKGERQNIGEEKFDCASRSPINELETKFNWLLRSKKLLPENEKWFREQGYITENGFEFSDAFIAIKSGTTKEGNSLKMPLQCIHEHGLIPKSKLPQLNSFHDNYNPDRITGSLLALGQQFLQRFKINYEKVLEVHYKELLKEDMLGVAGYAWETPLNSEYQKTDKEPNHAFLVYRTPAFYVFDNYEETPNDYIKKLSPSYDFLPYGYRVYITAQYLPSSKSWVADLISQLWQLFFPLKENVEEVLTRPIINKPIPMNEEKYQWDTHEHVRLSLRKMGDEFKLTPLQKDLLCDICYCESGYNPKAKLVNSTKSIDRGLFQWNNYWHPEITDAIAYDPEKNARLACQAILDGKVVTYWNASRSCWNQSGKYNSLLKIK